ncbi:MAG: hypothetical protein WB511_10975, partial [Nitrososphaeraceae archaeon]
MASSQATKASKPFVITSVIMLLFGSVLGSLWMMMLFNSSFPLEIVNALRLHRSIQINGFLTTIIMGISYMIVPRFRNISLPSSKLPYVSYILIVFSIVLSILSPYVSSHELNNAITLIENFSRAVAVIIFFVLIIFVLRVRPKLLKMADFFIASSVLLFVTLTISQSLNIYGNYENILLWLMFPILMIFGIEYKTLPSFIGFIWPRKKCSIICVTLLLISIGLGLTTLFYGMNNIIQLLFSISLLAGTGFFTLALNIFGGFDNSNILRLSKDEKRARYKYTLLHIKLSFIFLFLGLVCSLLSIFFPNIYTLRDMWIHTIAIGFIGVTIALYLPLMLSPIIGRTIRFLHFSKIPIILII